MAPEVSCKSYNRGLIEGIKTLQATREEEDKEFALLEGKEAGEEETDAAVIQDMAQQEEEEEEEDDDEGYDHAKALLSLPAEEEEEGEREL